MDYFDRLGAALEDAWTTASREEERFPDAALEVLERLPPRDAFDREALLDHLLDPHRPVPMQLAPLGAFGQPGFTVFHGHGFVVELYHWVESLSAIHNHPFCGVFTIVDGFSVHARYEVGASRPLGGRARHVHLRLEALDLVEAGTVVPFSLQRHPLVHALVHVPRSSISMVVRTVRTEGYFRYLPPHLALPMDGEGEPLGRQLTLLDALTRVGDPGVPARLRSLLQRADFELALRVLSAQWPLREEVERAALLDVVRPRLGEATELLPPVLERAARLHDATAIRESLADPDLRLVSVVLGYAERRDQVLDLLASRDADPVALLHRFVDDAMPYDEDERPTAIIAHALIDGRGEHGAIDDLRRAYDAETVERHRPDISEFCRDSLFSMLDEPGDGPGKVP